MILPVSLAERSYEIVLERRCSQKATEYLDLERNVLVVTDDGVPAVYVQNLAAACRNPIIVCLPHGERSKSLDTFRMLLEKMAESHFTREDCVLAAGGGVVGDIAGFAASCYMRGIDFYNVPTTVLSQVDSSIGGKTAVNAGGIKNIFGSFYQPKKVLIDPELLNSLSLRQRANGLAESVKMALLCDESLFRLFESDNVWAQLDLILEKSLRIKKSVVEADEKEAGLRRILNFGHTIGHGIESTGQLLHGECVALGMIPMCGAKARARLLPVLRRLSLPTVFPFDAKAVTAAMLDDKKRFSEGIRVTTVPEIGRYEQEVLQPEELEARLEMIREGAKAL